MISLGKDELASHYRLIPLARLLVIGVSDFAALTKPRVMNLQMQH